MTNRKPPNPKGLNHTAAIAMILLLAAGADSLSAKFPTVKITIAGPALKKPIEISGPAASSFSVYAGPGVRVDGKEQDEGFIIDWRRGAAPLPPEEVTRFQINFYGGSARAGSPASRSERLKLIYTIVYAYDPSSDKGFVFLPGGPNTQTIYRGGLEGFWFHENQEWKSFVRPFLAEALR